MPHSTAQRLELSKQETRYRGSIAYRMGPYVSDEAGRAAISIGASADWLDKHRRGGATRGVPSDLAGILRRPCFGGKHIPTTGFGGDRMGRFATSVVLLLAIYAGSYAVFRQTNQEV